MSTLKERLGRLKKTADGAAAAQTASSGDARAEEAQIERLGASWERLEAQMHFNDWGQFIIRRRRYPLHYAHGTYRLGELCGEAEPLSVLAETGGKRTGRKGRALAGETEAGTGGRLSCVSVHHSRLLFLDTETTGLGVGAGNVPFMIGIGFYDGDGFVVEQLFIRNPAEEASMLHHLRERMAERDMLVSYNGKCFDWPILKNRYILNRQKEHAADPVHFDFLYPSRSLWRNTLPSCRLSSVERERLGLRRTDDVPGSLAPALYFQYLAEGDPALLAGVFEHNEKDVLTLACLAAHFAKLLRGDMPLARLEEEELFRLALWLDKLGRADGAEEALRELLGREAERTADYWLPAAEFYKRQGRFAPAVSLWERAIERKRRSRIASLAPYVELAMYYEHRDKNYERALSYAEEALERARGRLSAARLDGAAGEELEAIRKRVDRLRAKRDAAARKEPAARAAAAPIAGKRAGRRQTAGVWQELLPIEGADGEATNEPKRRMESR
ncbi:ribonuclease H-like domain-containing protein [Paenibacillus sp. GYB003]|uniref:ribonuclease H-like domain-containing protein n=1 Tax=Paenibacillus sp. GYB003 TaxID=2994392 RepID=UPI002F96CC56